MSELDYTTYKKGLILSANDVMANVLLLYDDEGFAPMNIATVSLPYGGREYRAKSSNGKSKFQRGDLITIECKVTEHKKAFFDEKAISEFLELKIEGSDSDKMDQIVNQFDQEAKFAKEWADLEQRDFTKRTPKTVLDGKT
jgi:hypothetical protein